MQQNLEQPDTEQPGVERNQQSARGQQRKSGKVATLLWRWYRILRLTLLHWYAQLRKYAQPTIVIIGQIKNYRHTDYALLLIASITGVLIGLFTVVFHRVLELAEQLFHTVFLAAETIAPVRLLVFPLIPALGGLAVGMLNQTVFRGVGGVGLLTVARALAFSDGKLHWRHSLRAILTAALSIGSGGGAGREGPSVLLGASIGSTLGQIFQLSPEQLRILCGSGTAAAISAIFNAPLGGIVFALEAIMGEVEIRSFVPLVVASVLATATTRLFVGNNPLLISPDLGIPDFSEYILLAIAGMLSGFVALYFLTAYRKVFRAIYRFLLPIPFVWRPAIGGLLAGILVVLLPTMLETTYEPINQAISGKGILWIAALSVLAKPISNAITLGSGGAGGTMAPALKTGALFGFCLGSIIQLVLPETQPGFYALVCAAAVLAGTFQIPLAGGIILFEISGNYDLILPLLFSSVFASFIVQRFNVRTFNPIQEKITRRSVTPFTIPKELLKE